MSLYREEIDSVFDVSQTSMYILNKTRSH